MSDSVLSEEELTLLNDLNPVERQHLLFGLLYLANRPVSLEEMAPIYNVNTVEEFRSVVVPVLKKINEELASRSAPYTIYFNEEDYSSWLHLTDEMLEKINFSTYIFLEEQKELSREKMKVLSFIAYKTIIQHLEVTLDDIMAHTGVTGVNLVPEIEKEGWIYQKKSKRSDSKNRIISFELTNKFYDSLGFPQESLELSKVLRDQMLRFLEEEVNAFDE